MKKKLQKSNESNEINTKYILLFRTIFRKGMSRCHRNIKVCYVIFTSFKRRSDIRIGRKTVPSYYKTE